MAHNVTLIPGDGTGPEITEATRRVLQATGVDFAWDVQHAGANMLKTPDTPLPDPMLESLWRNRVALKGPTTTPIGAGLCGVNALLRSELDLYAYLLLCKSYRGLRSRYANVDLVVVSENSVTGSERIIRFAFDYAKAHERRTVTAMTVAGTMNRTVGHFLEAARAVASEYPGIGYDEALVDGSCNQLEQMPELYDVVVLPRLSGDVISDLCGGPGGGLGLAPCANIGPDIALFGPAHGSKPKYTGMNKVNPMAMMLSGVMLLRHLQEERAANRLEQAIADVIADGKAVTYDMKPDRNDPTAVGTSQAADGVIARLMS